jgi:hypothetical protein
MLLPMLFPMQLPMQLPRLLPMLLPMVFPHPPENVSFSASAALIAEILHLMLVDVAVVLGERGREDV